MWNKGSPQVTLQPTDGLNKGQIINDFDLRIIRHQPLTYLKVVAGDVVYSFSPVRGDGPEHYPTRYHDFHPFFPADQDERAALITYTGSGPRVQPALAGFLTGYGRDFYVPGPLLAAGLVTGLAAMAGIGRARRSRLRGPSLLFTLGAIFAIFPPFIIATFDWRYELPQLCLIPIAAVIGLKAMTDRTSVSRPPRRDAESPPAPIESEAPARSRPAETVAAIPDGPDDTGLGTSA
jgi:hypothetical protein